MNHQRLLNVTKGHTVVIKHSTHDWSWDLQWHFLLAYNAIVSCLTEKSSLELIKRELKLISIKPYLQQLLWIILFYLNPRNILHKQSLHSYLNTLADIDNSPNTTIIPKAPYQMVVKTQEARIHYQIDLFLFQILRYPLWTSLVLFCIQPILNLI